MNIFAKIGTSIDIIRNYWNSGGMRKFIPFQSFQSELTPNWLPYTNASLLEMYNTIPEVNAIISYIASVASKVPFVLESSNGKIKESHPLIDLFNNPTSNDSYERWQSNNCASFFVLGNIYLNASKPSGFESFKRIYQLPSYLTKIYTNYTDKNGNLPDGIYPSEVVIKNYIVEENEKKLIYDYSEILHIKDSNINYSKGQWLYGQSRLYSAVMAITSLKSIYEAKVNAYQKGGAQFFISPQNPMVSISPEEKSEWENNFFSNYGMTNGKSPYYFSNSPVNITAMGVNIAQLQLTQMSQHDFGILCAVIGGFPSRLLNDNRASTYNNILEDKKSLYTSIIMPYLDLFWASINNYFNKELGNLRFRAYYDDIEELQKDKKTQAETYNAWFVLGESMRNAGYLTRNEVLQMMDLPKKNEENFNNYEKTTSEGVEEESQQEIE